MTGLRGEKDSAAGTICDAESEHSEERQMQRERQTNNDRAQHSETLQARLKVRPWRIATMTLIVFSGHWRPNVQTLMRDESAVTRRELQRVTGSYSTKAIYFRRADSTFPSSERGTKWLGCDGQADSAGCAEAGLNQITALYRARSR